MVTVVEMAMRSLVLLALLALPVGCAHRDQNLAVRKDTKPPRGDFSHSHARETERGQPASEAPLANPPVP